MTNKDLEIKQGNNGFYVGDSVSDYKGIITFVREGDNTIIIDHTVVKEELRGMGIARKLVDRVVEYARAEDLKIIPQCSYAVKVLTTNDEYKDVLA
ncbi:MAG TPA: N-acetyltransferase [Clostridiales bacterium]|nr:N-acetyltransferase [Clostridiales bacterium]